MFEIEKVSAKYYRLWEGDEHIGDFEWYGEVYIFNYIDCIYQNTNPSIFPFILKTLENLNNGVVYE